MAEHALASALPGLEEPELTEAKFLLVEVLQEQGRWLESLDLLSTLKAHATSDRTQEALVLTQFAKIHLGTLSTQEMYQRFSELLKLAHTGPDPRMRAKAARAAAWLVGAARSVSAAEELLRVVDQIPETELDPDSLGTLSLAKAMLLYHLRRTSGKLGSRQYCYSHPQATRCCQSSHGSIATGRWLGYPDRVRGATPTPPSTSRVHSRWLCASATILILLTSRETSRSATAVWGDIQTSFN